MPMQQNPATLIVIPARYGSRRFPGKPLARLGGKTILQRVFTVAQEAAAQASVPESVSVLVTTEDERIAAHCVEIGAHCVMTPESCRTGSDRVLAALRQLSDWPDFVINLQGDAPFTPPSALHSLIRTFQSNPRIEVATPVHKLSWDALDALRESKKTAPFSGTTVILNDALQALWFSKTIVPAIRNEESLRRGSDISPVWQHLGLYGFRVDILEKFCMAEESPYERLEGLEQLRMIENGIRIQAVPVTLESGGLCGGIDTPEDLARAQAALGDKPEPTRGLFRRA